MQNQLEWSILEVDEEEWQRHTSALDSAAAANGFPVFADRHPAGADRHNGSAPAHGFQRRSYGRQVVLVVAIVLLLMGCLSYLVWQAAQQGITRVQQDVANAVKLQTIRAQVEQPQLRQHVAVEAVELVNDTAMIQAVITETRSSGQVAVHRRNLFFVQTPQGWQAGEPSADLWGESQVLDTPNLHFVYHSKDHGAVEQLALGAEAVYVALRRATGQEPAAAGERLTVEIVPGPVLRNKPFANGSVRLPSPLLFDLVPGDNAEALLAHLARAALANQMLDTTLRRTPNRPRWQPMVEALRIWLQNSSGLLPAAASATYGEKDARVALLHLRHLLGCDPCHNDGSSHSPSFYISYDVHGQEQRFLAAYSLIEFIAARHGSDTLPKLLTGFSEFDDWETLAPAVLGSSAAELEAAWHAAAN